MSSSKRLPRAHRRARGTARSLVAVFAGIAVCLGLAVVAPLWFADSAPGAAPAPVASSRDVEHARAALTGLETVSGQSIARYYRESFGTAWHDLDRNGCDTRNDVLRRDLHDTVLKDGTNGCKVLAGVLVDPYTGERVEFVSGTDTSVLVQIDHLVPLAWAWRHGAEFWSDQERLAFANDPDNLRATAGAVNQSKGDSGPEEWLPPSEAAHCVYVSDYVAVLDEWDLGVTGEERTALERVLARC
ncbi:HNH endonuclease family protein [Microbacterium lushaniae]|uniref:HNH endonuclease family protein n=1 Tax=Microbacterium lushaniae TaxID=2614639 RepID=UPI001930F13F|nr:HNH endonuclease family protein [Microbacterium lushaniae]